MESDNAEIETGGTGDANRLTMSEGSSSDAEVHPLDLFPAEVWLDIFQWLDTPQDLLNLVNTCTTFEVLLEVGRYNIPGAGKSVCQLDGVLPLVINYLGKADILNLRASCRRISQSVDKALSETCCYENLHVHHWLLPNFDQRYLKEFSFERRNLKLSLDEHPCLILDSVEKIDEVTAELESRRSPHCRRGPRIVGNRVLIRFFRRPHYRDPIDDRIVYDVEAEGELDEKMDEEDEDIPEKVTYGDIEVDDNLGNEEEGEEDSDYSEDDEMDLEGDDKLGDDKEEEQQNGLEEEREQNDLDEEEDEPIGNDDNDDDFDDESDPEEEDGIPPALLPDLSDLRIPFDRNPILRYIRSEGPAILRQRDFLEHVLNFLRKFPDQVQGVILQLTHDPFKTRTYQMIRDVIAPLPNIETLEIYIRCHHLRSTPDIPSDEKALKTLIKVSPLPSAPDLKRIRIHSYHPWPEAFLREIGERFGGNLLDLDISISDDVDFASRDMDVTEPIQIESMEFPALRSLKLSLSSWYLPVLPSIQAPELRTLKVSGSSTYWFDKTPKEIQLMDILRRYPMLRTYCLEFNRPYGKSLDDALEALRSTDFRHANLRTVIIRDACFERNMPLSFFPRLCPKLKFMIYDDGGEDPSPTKDRDLKLLRSRHMKQSTLWQICPDLLMIRHIKDVYPDIDDETEDVRRHVYECTRVT